MDKKVEAKDALSQFKAFLSGLTGSEAKAEDVVVEAELSAEDTVEETVEASTKEEAVIEEPVKAELSAEEPTSYITKEEFVQFQTELTSVLKDAMEAMKSEKAELSKEVAELSAQPATDAIVHSPESEDKAPQGRSYGHNRPSQYIDRVLGEMNKYN